MKSIKPPKIREGDTVGVFSPSWPVTSDVKHQFDRGIKTLQSFGLEVKLAKHTLGQYYYSSATRENRLMDFQTIWKDPDVKMVLMSQGGNTAIHLLDGIDYDMIREDPKIFAGISDGTTLLNAVYAETGLVTYHGPDLMWCFGREMTPQITENIVKTFFDGEVRELIPNTQWKHQEKNDLEYSGWKCIREGKCQGHLVGGHIRTLSNVVLAGYGPIFDGAILFLEGTDNVARTDSYISALELHGVFNRIAGLILGWFEDSALEEKELNRTVSEVFLEGTKGYDFPILEIGELGHNVENYVFPIGCKATLDAARLQISIDESTVN